MIEIIKNAKAANRDLLLICSMLGGALNPLIWVRMLIILKCFVNYLHTKEKYANFMKRLKSRSILQNKICVANVV